MVNTLQTFRARVVKVEPPRGDDARPTAKGGLAAVQALANRLGLWTAIARLLPPRKDPTQGFSVAGVVCALIHGLLAGGEGFQATEPMRADLPLLKMLGMSAAPSAETVEEVVKHLAKEGAIGPLNRALRRQALGLLKRMSRRSLLEAGHGFLTLWLDGSLLQVTGKTFEAVKTIKGESGPVCVGGFVGPCATAMDIAPAGVGEETLAGRYLEQVFRAVIVALKMQKDTLILLDSLYGDGPILDRIEALPGSPSYIVGVGGLAAADHVMADLPESAWRETGPNPKRGWSESAYAVAWVQCKRWNRKRLMVCHRWKNDGEWVMNYFSVVTSLRHNDSKIIALMTKWRLPFEETIWRLYSHKQGLENLWKELLEDLGLHHPPSAKAAANAVFYAVGALAYNLAVGVRRLGFEQAEDQRMRLWRFRREVIDLAAVAATRSRQVFVRLIDARDWLIDRLLSAMERLARC